MSHFSARFAVFAALAALVLPATGAVAAGYNMKLAIAKQRQACLADGGHFIASTAHKGSYICSYPNGSRVTCSYTLRSSVCFREQGVEPNKSSPATQELGRTVE